MRDIQSGKDTRAVAINRVGVRALRLPMMFYEDDNGQPTVGEWEAATDLAHERRGTHMSRLVRILHDRGQQLGFDKFCQLPTTLMSSLSARACFVAVNFPFFIAKTAPISGEKGFIDVRAKIFCAAQQGGQRNLLQVSVPVTSLCPCSKAIAKYGAHNQRSNIIITVEIDARSPLRIRDLVAMAEGSASCGLYSVLKRGDEKMVTETAYDNPKFVEDIIRDLAVYMERAGDIKNYRVAAENFESIHNHSAFAVVQTADFPAALLS